jgi:L-2,4-diaminobutyric acid acetyltransferase
MLEDAPAITTLIRGCDALDANSHYTQLLLCHHFGETCLLAEAGSHLAGFVSAYRPPASSDVLFVWQVAVAAESRGTGIGGRLLTELVRRVARSGVRYVEATITPSNSASLRLFESFARRHNAAFQGQCLFPEELFHGVEQHEAEYVYRIGPLASNHSEQKCR